MTRRQKLLERALAGPKNFRFGDLVRLVEAFGFRLERVSGSHHVFVHPDVREVLSLQSAKGKAKPYQVQQFLSLVEEYNLMMEAGS